MHCAHRSNSNPKFSTSISILSNQNLHGIWTEPRSSKADRIENPLIVG
jgi:hypothetical protein